MPAFPHIELFRSASQLGIGKSINILLQIGDNMFQLRFSPGNSVCFAVCALRVYSENNKAIDQHIAIILQGQI